MRQPLASFTSVLVIRQGRENELTLAVSYLQAKKASSYRGRIRVPLFYSSVGVCVCVCACVL